MTITSNLITKSLTELNYKQDNSLNEYVTSNSYSLIIPVKLRDCYVGEIFNFEQKQCEICEKGYFSRNINDLNCTICPNNTFCPGGTLILNKRKLLEKFDKFNKYL